MPLNQCILAQFLSRIWNDSNSQNLKKCFATKKHNLGETSLQ